METINNVDHTLKNDLCSSISKRSKISIASACFSLYAYQELKKQFNDIDGLRFIFTSPTFVKEKAPKEQKQFYIPRISRERSLYGTEFEVRLRNELTQKAIAKECADWIREKTEFKSNITNEGMNNFICISNPDGSGCSYLPVNGFTTVDLGCERGNNISNAVVKFNYSETKDFIRLFDEVWTDENKLQDVKDMVLDSITAAYVENPPELIYYITLYNIFNTFLDDISEDYLPNEGVGFRESAIWKMLYSFQKDAAIGVINKLETFNGCILADSVGLGKTFTALAVIKYYESRNKNVLVLCPKKLSDNWNTYKSNYRNNPISSDRLRYDVLFHTDLSRRRGMSNGIDLNRINWGNYDLVVIDESHNFRNGEDSSTATRENRYTRLMNDVVKSGVQTKVLMLSATPVNNRFYDLRNQLEIAYEGNPQLIQNNLNISRSMDEVFRNAQAAFNKWSKFAPEERTTDNLLKMLDFDFFEILDSVTIARSRKHIEKYYSMEEIGKFPTRLQPISLRPNITDLPEAITFSEINEMLNHLNLAVYVPTDFILPSKRYKYSSEDNLSRSGREMGIRRLMSIALLKRLESSIHSFRITLNKVLFRITQTIQIIDKHNHDGLKLNYTRFKDSDFDEDNDIDEIFAQGKISEIDIDDLDYVKWKQYLESDQNILNELIEKTSQITPENDKKLKVLTDLILEKVRHPINNHNRKVLIFSAFADTADYLYDNLCYTLEQYGLNLGKITGSGGGNSTIEKLHNDFNDILTCFSPQSKNGSLILPEMDQEIDILIGTDCISEGQNLQDCDYCVNYDIHWNPVRIIQRFGRIDRIGSKNDVIQLVNFWPDVDLDEYIKLKDRVETRMKISVLSSTGDDDLINSDEHGDLEYRAQQLKRLQSEVVDIEDMQTGISIMDLGLNEFRMDLLDYVKSHQNLETIPYGLHAVVPSSVGMPSGALFVLKNINNNVNKDNQNRLHPFYMVYVRDDGSIECDHLSPKKMLDLMRFSCKGKDEPLFNLCNEFNKQTKDGHDMKHTSELLESSIESIMDVKQQSDLDSFLNGGNISFRNTKINGLDDFELICFLVIR